MVVDSNCMNSRSINPNAPKAYKLCKDYTTHSLTICSLKSKLDGTSSEGHVSTPEIVTTKENNYLYILEFEL